MKIIKIGFSSPKNDLMIFGRAIEVIEKRPFSHAFVIYKDPILGTEMVFQASHGIVHNCEYVKLKENNTVICEYSMDFTEAEFYEFYTLMISMLGVPYAWKQILGIFISKIFGCKNIFEDSLSTEFCSQLAAKVCKIKNIPIPDKTNTITPSDLNEILKSYYAK